MQSKRCSKCGVTKTLAEFWRDRTRIDGMRAQCKKCTRAYNRAYYDERREERRAYYEDHLEARRAYQLAYREAHREELLAYKRAYREEHREERRAYREKHNAEINAQNRKWQTEARKASREVATRNGEPWTAAEDHVVLTSEGTMLEIAIELGRTIDSVHGRRKLLRRKAVTA